MKQKIIVFFLFSIFLFPNLDASSISIAPNTLEVDIGQYVKGNYRLFVNMTDDFPDFEMIMGVTIKIENEFSLSDVSEDLIQISIFYDVISTNDTYAYNADTQWTESYLVWKKTREIVIPVAEYDYINGSVHYYASMLDYTTFTEMNSLENLVISFDNGTSILWSELDFNLIEPEDNYDFYMFVAFIYRIWLNKREFTERTMLAISPQTQVGQIVDHGWYNGTILDETTVEIDSKIYSVKHSYLPHTMAYYNNDPMSGGIGMFEHDIYYHSETGLILQFNYSDDSIDGSFVPYEFHSPNNNTITLNIESLLVLVGLTTIGTAYYVRKKKKC